MILTIEIWHRFVGLFTDSTKINSPGHNICMYWAKLWQPTVHIQNHIFEKTLIKVCSSHLHASFGTFCVQIGQFFEARWIFKHSEEFRFRRHFASMTAICRFSNKLQRVTVSQIIDRFGRKRCQKKRKDVNYKLLEEFFQKYFGVHEQKTVKNSFSTYVFYAPDGLFWLNLYHSYYQFKAVLWNGVYTVLEKLLIDKL